MSTTLAITYDRVRETTDVLGTGNVAFTGTMIGFRTFDSVLVVGDLVPYCIENGAEWEVGIGTYLGASTMSRDALQVQASSAGAGVLVNFTGLTKNIFITGSAQAINKIITHNCSVHRNKVLTGETVVVPADSFILGLTSFAVDGTLDNQGAIFVL